MRDNLTKLLILTTIFLTGFVTLALAEESSQSAVKKYNITFPIKELGGCTNLTECQKFCDDPINHDTCLNFAKSKGFYKETQSTTNEAQILSAAKSELGCSSKEECMQLCQKQENVDKCSNFAKRHNLGGGETADPGQAEILAKAKQILGCDSKEACMQFCAKSENQQKCSEFAKQVGLRGGNQMSGPGGCHSGETCRAYCSDPNHFNDCQQFAKEHSSGDHQGGSHFHGPGGCDSEASCRSYCQQHQSECQHFGQSPTSSSSNAPTHSSYPDPKEYCARTPGCSWDGQSCLCSTPSQSYSPRGETTSSPKASSTTSNPGIATTAPPNADRIDSCDLACQQNRCSSTLGYHWTGSACVPN